MLREQVAKKTPLGVATKMIIYAGGLFSDDIVTRDQLKACKNGSPQPTLLRPNTSLATFLSRACADFVHDGFSHKVPQAEKLNAIVTSRKEALYSVVELVISN